MGGRVGLDRGFQTWNEGDDGLYGRDASVLGERALRWIDAMPGPFFLYVHTLEPHSPYAPGAEDAAPFDEPYSGDRDTRALLRLGQLGQLAPEGLRFLESQYLGEVRKNDRAFGELLDALRAAGRLEDTLVVFTADHGEELLDHGGTEHAKTLYQELIRVPLAVRLPGGARAGRRLAGTVEQVDLLPTLLGLAGVEPPASLPGRDLSRWWQGRAEAPAPPVVFSEERFAVVDKFAARAGPLKLIFNNDGPALWRKGAHVELYDLEADPAERVNLADARPIASRYLLQELERFRRRAPGSRAESRLVLSGQERDALKALGYVH
jgi:arylsulfatase A-like enzyme